MQGYCGWGGARTFIFYLDKKLPFEENPGKRIAIQLIGTTLIGLFIISVLTELVSLVAKGKMVPLEFYLFDLFIIGIWFFVSPEFTFAAQYSILVTSTPILFNNFD